MHAQVPSSCHLDISFVCVLRVVLEVELLGLQFSSKGAQAPSPCHVTSSFGIPQALDLIACKAAGCPTGYGETANGGGRLDFIHNKVAEIHEIHIFSQTSLRSLGERRPVRGQRLLDP